MKTLNTQITPQVTRRRGSTLIIVIALLGLLAFMGMIFFSFASQERASAEFFSEAAKGEIDEPDNVWDHPLRQIISGTSNRPTERGSILRSRDRRLSIVANMVGSDLAPHSGQGIETEYNVAGLPVAIGPGGNDWLDFVDSPAARFGSEDRPVAPPAVDVDYTYPDINNLFLAYKGWAIRDNGGSFERVPVIIPSFFRPQYMKTGNVNGPGASNTPTDLDWTADFVDGTARLPGARDFSRRSFRPHALHIAGFLPDGTTPVFRFLTNAANSALSTPLASGGFPFIPEDTSVSDPTGGNGVLGELGIWTGSDPNDYELDADNDGDGIREGIWLDTHFPVQEDPSGRLYTVLHSFTIYDLDGLINLNVHGNLAGLDRSGNVQAIAGSGLMNEQFLSKSNMGLGPNEVNPLWALRTNLGAVATADVIAQFQHHFAQQPTSGLEQANMEWLWLMAGRAQIDDSSGQLEDLHPGRWGENERLFNAYRPGTGTFLVADLPRPGRSGDAQMTGSSGIRYGGAGTGGIGRDGFDDNQDRLDGELNPSLGRVRSFGTPMDFAGTGRTHTGTQGMYATATGTFPLTGDMRLPLVHHDTATYGPERFLRFNGYSLKRDVDSGLRYIFGQNNAYDNGTGDDLIANPFYDAPFEDPLESIFDPDLADRDFDRIFGPQDLLALHLTSADIGSSPDDISPRLQKLSPYALDDGNAPFEFKEQTTPGVRSRLTTISNSLHRFMMRSPFGADGRPGDAGVNDDGDGTVDEPDEVLATSYKDSDTNHRFWEFTADADNDGLFEFPPVFGPATPYTATDPFRPQVRRMLTIESGEGRALVGQMPISPNHILDVERNIQTPEEGTPEFLRYMQRAGMRFRPLIDHPLASEAASLIPPLTMPTWSAATPVPFPPQSVLDREFWARRDRQKLARDIYVLLYTIGGAGQDAAGTTLNYTNQNDANAGEGASLYTHDQLRRMAQFAVNLVDAMDSDNVITKFEYDKNLGNGWSLDDDAVTADYSFAVDTDSDFLLATGNGIYREDQTVNGAGVPERGVVYGVEAQDLAISETQGIRSNQTGANNDSTPYPDHTMARDFLFVELQNVRPTAVTLGESVSMTADTAIWRLARYDRTANTDPVKPMAAPDKVLAILHHDENVVDGGGRFSIGVSNDTGLATSSFFVDIGTSGAFDGTYELIAPDVAAPTLPTTLNQTGSADPAYVPLVDIDVNHQDHNGGVGAARFAAPSGNFLDATPTSLPLTLIPYAGNQHFEALAGGKSTFTDPGGAFGFDLVLQRRANPNMPQLSIGDNPWIDVDRTRATFDTFAVQDMSTPAQIYDGAAMPRTDLLYAIASTERDEPLDDTVQTQSTPKTATGYRGNTIKGDAAATKNDMLGINSVSLTDRLLPASITNPALPFEIWQPHFDREYASSGEFLSLPLVGPNLLTQRLNRMRYPGYQQSFPDPKDTSIGPQKTNLLSSAEAMLLWPNFTDVPDANFDTVVNSDDSIINTSRDNRWYRLLQFVEVPSRVHRMLGNYLTLTKIPGKININMIRHREVLAGLIDNPYLADVPPLADAGATAYEYGPFMTSAPNVGGRDLYRDFLRERDGSSVTSYDPTAATSREFWIPGTPKARPFRSFGALGLTAAAENQLDRSMLRRLAADRDDDGDGNDEVIVAGISEPESNRHWLELADPTLHATPDVSVFPVGKSSNAMTRHGILSKALNNTTTVSNTFIVYGTAAYFEVHEDAASGLFQVGGRFDLDGDGDETNDQQRAVFVIDRTDAFEAYDPGTGDFDWKRLIKARATIE